MRRLFALILASLSFVSASLYGQGIITGVVTDSFTGEPLPNATVYVNGTTNGTTTGEDGQLLFDWEKENLSSRVTKVKGFSRPVQFYSPQYPDGPIPGEIDSRRTLYWNPNVVTDYDGNARVEFYNNSFTKRFTISGAGITTSGEPYVLRQNW